MYVYVFSNAYYQIFIVHSWIFLLKDSNGLNRERPWEKSPTSPKRSFSQEFASDEKPLCRGCSFFSPKKTFKTKSNTIYTPPKCLP